MCAMLGWFSDGERLGFTLEAREPLGVRCERLGQHLDRDVAIRASCRGAIHLAHAAGPKGREDFVRAKSGAESKGQRRLPVDYTGGWQRRRDYS